MVTKHININNANIIRYNKSVILHYFVRVFHWMVLSCILPIYTAFFFHIHGSCLELNTLNLFVWLLLVEVINNMASKQAPLRLIVHTVCRFITVHNHLSMQQVYIVHNLSMQHVYIYGNMYWLTSYISHLFISFS